MSAIIAIIVGILVLALCCYLVTLLPIDNRLKQVIDVVLVIVFIIWLATRFIT